MLGDLGGVVVLGDLGGVVVLGGLVDGVVSASVFCLDTEVTSDTCN